MSKKSQRPTAEGYRSDFYPHQIPPGEEAHRRLLADWESLMAQAPSERRDIELYCFTAGLIAYGHLERVPQLLELMPQNPGLVQLVAIVTDLLPAPAHFNLTNRDQHATFLEWFAEHRERLSWSESAGRFVASDLP